VSIRDPVLGDVLGQRTRVQQPPAQPKHVRLPARQRWAECLAVAGQDRRHQFGVVAPVTVVPVTVVVLP
jgi:hypothetical protein